MESPSFPSGSLLPAGRARLVEALFLLSALAALTEAGKVTSLWVFGDDYVDLGTGMYTKLGRQCAVPPYGQASGGPSGRCSDGKVLADRLAQQLGTVVGPYDGPAEYQANGVAFAAAGAGALGGTNARSSVSLDKQLKQFEKYIRDKGLKNLNESLVMISAGTNDYLQAIAQGKDPMSFVDTVVPRLVAAVQRIQKVSRATKFVVLGVPPLGCLPYVRQKFFAPSNSCLTNLNAVSQFHESRLDVALDALAQAQPNGQPVYFSRFSLSTAVLDKDHGMPAFSKPFDLACGQVGQDGTVYTCGENVTWSENGQSMTAPVLAGPMSGYDYFWWDWFNPTQNAFYALWVGMWMGVNPNAIYPVSVSKLLYI